MLRLIPLLAAGLVLSATAAHAASLSRTYSYFTIGGATLSEIEEDLGRLGPQVSSTGRRHPGATTMQFDTTLTYASTDGGCRIAKAVVRVSAKMTLPRWNRPGHAEQSTGIIWATLSADIKRHEESHAGIAKNHARELEEALGRLGHFSDCEAAKAGAQSVTDRLLARHDEDQARFDRIEEKTFEARFMRLLNTRLERMAAEAEKH